jgi:hypothetical protein
MRIADLLRSRGLPGTFYVPISGYKGRKTVNNSELRGLCSQGFEIGAHSVSHRSLSKLSRQEMAHEVRDCKEMVEQASGGRVVMFCYPNGRYNAAVMEYVKQAGYSGARTTRMLSLEAEFLPLEMPTTLQAFPHSTSAYVKNLLRARNVPGLITCLTEFRELKSWVDLGKQLFNYVLQYGGIWHLYGHSWEIAELGMWSDLTNLLDYVARRDGVTYLTNGKLSCASNLPIARAGQVSLAFKRAQRVCHNNPRIL